MAESLNHCGELLPDGVLFSSIFPPVTSIRYTYRINLFCRSGFVSSWDETGFLIFARYPVSYFTSLTTVFSGFSGQQPTFSHFLLQHLPPGNDHIQSSLGSSRRFFSQTSNISVFCGPFSRFLKQRARVACLDI